MQRENAVVRLPMSFDCGGGSLIGVLDLPASPKPKGVIIVVGGPQYRVGSHRQFVKLAQAVSLAGYAVLRFDHRGIGDSTGGPALFDNLDDDIEAAIDTLFAHVAEVREVVIWGLCDAASAAMMYAGKDDRVTGLVLLNPWVRSEQGLAQSYLRHYYASRIMNFQFWGKLFSGKLKIGRSMRSFFATIREAIGKKIPPAEEESGPTNDTTSEPFQSRMLSGVDSFAGRILIILSGDDITANEFQMLIRQNRAWKRAMRRRNTEFKHIAAANHTFSRASWRKQVEEWTVDSLTNV